MMTNLLSCGKRALICVMFGLLTLSMVGYRTANAANAGGTPVCGSNRDIRINELNAQDSWSEVFVTNAGVTLDGWTLSISRDNANPTSKSLGNGDGCVNSSGGSCVQDALSPTSYGVPSWINFASFSIENNKNSQVALFKGGVLQDMVTFSTGASCNYTNTHWGNPGACNVCVTGVGSAIKNYFAVPDGSGQWGNSNTGNSGGAADGSQGSGNTADVAGCSIANSDCFHTFSFGTETATNYCTARTITVPVSLVYADKSGNPITASPFVIPKWSPSLSYVGTPTVTSGSATVSAQTWIGSTASATTTAAKTYTLTNVQGDANGQLVFKVADAALPGVSRTQTITLPSCLLADWRMDESAWSGTANEVIDSSGKGNHGTAKIANGSTLKPTTASASPAYSNAGQSTCNYGQFDSTSGTTRTYTYVELSNMPALPSSFTFAAWIRSSNATAQHQRILVRDDANDGWGLSLADGTGQAKLRFFNRKIANSGAVTGQGSNPGCGVFCLDTNAVITSNAWYFIAATIDTAGKSITLYVYDTASATPLAKATAAFSGTWTDGTGRAAIGGETAASAEGRQASWHFLGNLDEVQVYSGVLTQTEVQNLRSRVRTCPSMVNHVELIHDGVGLTCMPEKATVLICKGSSSCNNDLPNQDATTSVNVTLATPTGATWVDGAGAVVIFPRAVSNNTSFYLSKTALPSPNPLRFSGSTSDASNATVQCYLSSLPDGGAPNATTYCDSLFAETGLVMTIGNQASCANSSALKIQAVQAAPGTNVCAPLPAFMNSTRSITFTPTYDSPRAAGTHGGIVFPKTIQVGAATSSLADAPRSVSLAFDGNAEASFYTRYDDAGQITLRADHAADTFNAALTGSRQFVVAPARFALSADDNVGPGMLNNASTAVNSSPRWPAGSPFYVDLQAQCSNGNLTASYVPSNASLQVTAHVPSVASGGTEGSLLVGGAAVGTTAANVSGQFENGKLRSASSYSEAGVVTLQASDANYFGVTVPAATTTIGRFVPAYFDTQFSFPAGCDGFLYASNDFASGKPVTARVVAKNAFGSTTRNYAYLSGAGLSRTVTLSNAGVVTSLQNNSIANTAVGTVTPGEASADTLTYKFTTLPAAPENFVLRASDAEGVSSNVSVVSYPLHVVEPTASVRQGRLRLSNVFGSEKSNLLMPARVQYWSGQSWVLNSSDNCTVLPANAFWLAGAPAGTGVGGAVAIAGGAGTLTLTRPSPVRTAVVDVAINLGGAAADNSCLATHGGAAANLPWLRSLNGSCSSTYDRDPAARATFGIFAPETRKAIHVQELF